MNIADIVLLKRGDVVLLDEITCAVIYLIIAPHTPTSQDFGIQDSIHPDEYWIEYFMHGSFTVEPISIRDIKYVGSLGENIIIKNQ